ncbi:hypothetical protein WHR41_02875 [Cladosporium halotolerans]|uniref:DUF7707 domain-containing protein n=1 Tax=Cladosporium halotolerans TaxID=1052096 RepID=A0AB34KUN2_9PEZI
MRYSAVFLAATAFSSLGLAQSGTNETGTGPTIDANSVPYQERQNWCRSQTQTCPQICDGRFDSNTCDPNTLTYGCVCADGTTPNTSDYEQTLPSFVCRKYRDQCVANNPTDKDAQDACLAIECGTKLPTEDSASSTVSSASSATESASSTGSGSSEASETASSTSGSEEAASQTASDGAASATADSAAVALNLASTYGTGLLAAGILGAFGLAL